jgi:hypothetical protein
MKIVLARQYLEENLSGLSPLWRKSSYQAIDWFDLCGGREVEVAQNNENFIGVTFL